ncbi:MAG: type II toxin-antitoxin system VapC family toxin [Bacteroidales bacterium]|nr:type II toxin-antitoxin system VapC family toxin [Bacteroidales bacterium]
MDLLLDTHTLIWFLNGDEQISDKAKALIEDSQNSKIVSIASIWEIAIKISLDKFRFAQGFKYFLDMVADIGFEILPITVEHALELSTLEFIHRDPFDRLLIAQSISDNLIIVTKNDTIKRYNIKTIW